ncbi:MAG: histone-like nucleoid-structuring protein Lsr2 [Actinomycetes bacterium]
MASRTEVAYLDDLDGSTAAETVSFGLDGQAYEIDLSEANAAALREAMAPYAGVARRMTPSGAPYTRVHVDPDPKVVRAWAGSAGVPCPARGRIPREVIEAFERAHASSDTG